MAAPKKLNAICFVIVLAVGMVFLSGCSNTGYTTTAPVTTLPPQIVHGTVLVSPPPTPTATLLPVAAESGNGKLTDEHNTSANAVSVEDLTGSLLIHIRAGGSVKGLKVFIARNGTNVPPVDYSYLPDGTIVEGQNNGYLQVTVLPDGKSEFVRLAPGSYTAYLPSMNIGQPPEEQSFMIRVNDMTHIWFEGFSASSGGCCGG